MNTKKTPSRTPAVRNDYRCSMERNQSGKYCVRVQVFYPRHAWNLGVFFLASSFDRAMKKLEESLDFLQRHEEKLWFWGVDRAEDMGFSAEFLRKQAFAWTTAPSFPVELPIYPWRRNAKYRPSSLAQFAADLPNRSSNPALRLLVTDSRTGTNA